MSYKVIHKHQLSMANIQTIRIPYKAEILRIDIQNELPVLWETHDFAEEETEEVRIIMVATGEDYDARDLTYLGTIQIHGFVWHFFEKKQYERVIIG